MERNISKKWQPMTGGFTLTELLVAMAIFTVLMSGLVTMFNAAVTSARQGYASIDAFDNARTALMTLDRDLTNAFASEEFGEEYNFYGRHNGFMYVGALDGGKIGRVTYVFHPELSKPAFTTTITERWDFIKGNVERQLQRRAREEGYYGAGAIAEVQSGIQNLIAIYGDDLTPPSPRTEPADDQLIELTVRIETVSMIRLEEAGVHDLDSFNMRVKENAAGTDDIRLDWPYVDAVDPLRDAVYATLDGNEAPQFDFLLSALMGSGSDMRTLYESINGGLWTAPLAGRVFLRVLGPESFDTLLRAKKREFWIRMLSGEIMGVEDLDPGSGGPEADGLGYWYDEELANIQPPINRIFNDRGHRVINEYVVADGIIGGATILDADGFPILSLLGEPLDALDAQQKFTYGDGKNGTVPYFNAAENLRNPDDPYETANYMGLLEGGSAFVEVDVVNVDMALADGMLNTNTTRKTLGSPLLPRLPQEVIPEFWVTRSKTRPGAAGFRRRFEQTIQLPAANGRKPVSFIAQGPGASL